VNVARAGIAFTLALAGLSLSTMWRGFFMYFPSPGTGVGPLQRIRVRAFRLLEGIK